ncbi:DUF1152 domain-containing protein [Actinomadura alba]|uniref:DUF1152 domain-containing protein n=1 Tax=Actinomadura alba TaxID=406431 RepID=A0ABR7M190_9ACTN|nr:DUF1152 domain-containing protein [Actinomadura alba]MBC6470658.1 DUF1152 domain-containing protein [Actinomadura alba]
MFSLQEPALFTRLRKAKRVLVAGAGGGFDVYAGLPLALALSDAGRTVHLANLSFTALYGLDADVWLDQDVAAIGPETAGPERYFPERTLARWLAAHHLPATVYAFPKVGVRPLRAAYRTLIERLDIDAVVLVDGGTDILMRGDESGLGTPEEDMASLAAVRGLDVPERIVACLGFGVDAYHGISHAHVLENLAALERDGSYLGAFSVSRASREGALYLDAVAHAQANTPDHPSIVNGSIAAAVRGDFGDVRFTVRTRNSELFVNPLMALYFAVTVDGLARRSLYLDRIERTVQMRQISSIIEEFREEVTPRPARPIPH